jgi:uncharacterized membrane protein (DUF373 family)
VWGHTNRESLASHKAFLGRPKAWRALKKVSLFRVLAVAEHIIYFFVALALIVPIVILFVSAAMSMLQVSEVGILQTVLAILDRVLLVFILVELLDTIRIIRREHGIIIAEPFLLVGLIAVVRRILFVTSQIEQARGTGEFERLLSELGVMAGLVVVLTIALFFVQRMHRSERETESSRADTASQA